MNSQVSYISKVQYRESSIAGAREYLPKLSAENDPQKMYELLLEVSRDMSISLHMNESVEEAAQRVIEVMQSRVATAAEEIARWTPEYVFEACNNAEHVLSQLPRSDDTSIKRYSYAHWELRLEYQKLFECAKRLHHSRGLLVQLPDFPRSYDTTSEYEASFQGDVQIIRDCIALVRSTAEQAKEAHAA